MADKNTNSELSKILDNTYKKKFKEFKEIFSNTNTDATNTTILNKMQDWILNSIFIYKDISNSTDGGFQPYVSGNYIIVQTPGTWVQDVKEHLRANKKDLLNTSIYDSELNNGASLLNSGFFEGNSFISTDIDFPEPMLEFISQSSRNQNIYSFQRSSIASDMSVKYYDNQELAVIRYHDLWYKSIELYKRGILKRKKEDNRKGTAKYFYDIPYYNAAWVFAIDKSFQIRTVFYLTGLAPTKIPIKSILGNSESLLSFTIPYKCNGLYYKFFKNNNEFVNALSEDKELFSQLFKKHFLNNNN